MVQRSLHIGINVYPGTGADLNGCVNDARDWADLCSSRGFTTSTLLNGEATLDGILTAIGQLVSESRAGDTALLTYSGHGTWTTDYDGDEADGRDEALCPSNILDTGPLSDDTLFTVFSSAADGVKLVFLSDSCHSGTVTRLMQPLNPLNTMRHRRARFMPPAVYTTDSRALADAEKVQEVPGLRASRQTALLLSGCRDTEYSYDAWFGGKANGAFTRVAIDTLRLWRPGAATYRTWWNAIRAKLPSVDYPQAPQLYGTESQKLWTALT